MEPLETIKRIGRFLDLDMNSLAKSVACGGSLTPGHNLGGNRLRFKKTFRLRLDDEYKKSMPRALLAINKLVSLPVNLMIVILGKYERTKG